MSEQKMTDAEMLEWLAGLECQISISKVGNDYFVEIQQYGYVLANCGRPTLSEAIQDAAKIAAEETA